MGVTWKINIKIWVFTTTNNRRDFTITNNLKGFIIINNQRASITSKAFITTGFTMTDSIITINKKTDSTMMMAFITKANPMESRNAPSQSLKRVDQRDEAENTKKLN